MKPYLFPNAESCNLGCNYSLFCSGVLNVHETASPVPSKCCSIVKAAAFRVNSLLSIFLP